MKNKALTPPSMKSGFRGLPILFLLLAFLWIPGTPSAEETSPPGDMSSTYLIGPGDTMEISVWKDESLSKQIIVPPDGVISFPLIGEIDATRLTVPALREIVRQRLMDYVPDATVTVLLYQANSLAAYVIGKVNKPGQYPITLETNVMQALAMAGGLNPFAAADKILILRRKAGKTQSLGFNYNDVKKGEQLEQNIILERGDVLVVP